MAAALVFVFGFGALVALNLQFGNEAVPDLWDYRSAVWGDGVCLPLMAWSLAALIQLIPVKPSLRFVATWSFVGGFIGVGVIVGWLLDDSPTTNWTLPAPHVLNLAGVYHAIFLVMAAAVFSGAFAAVFSALQGCEDPREVMERLGLLFPLAIGSATAYATFVASDSLTSARGLDAAVSIAAITLGVVMLVIVLRVTTGAWLQGGLLLVSVLVALALIVNAELFLGVELLTSTEFATGTTSLVRLAGISIFFTALATGLALVPTQRDTRQLLRGTFAFFVLTIGGYALFLADHWTTTLVTIFVTVLILFVLTLKSNPRRGRLAAIAPAATILGVIALTLRDVTALQSAQGLLLTTAFSIGFGVTYWLPIKMQFEHHMRAEMIVSNDRAGRQEFWLTKTKPLYVWMGCLVIGLLSTMIFWIAFALLSTEFGGVMPILALLAVITTAIIAFGLVWGRYGKRGTTTTLDNVPARWPLVVAASCAGAVGVYFLILVVELHELNLFVFVQSGLAAAFVANGVAQAGILLHGARVQVKSAFTVLLVWIYSCAGIYWGTIAAVGDASAPTSLTNSFLVISVTYISVAALALTCALALFVNIGRESRTLNPMVAGIAQDLGLTYLLVVFLIWFPYFVSNITDNYLSLLTIVLLPYSLCIPVFFWVLRNNDTHCGRERERRAKNMAAPGWDEYDAKMSKRLLSIPGRIRSARTAYLRRKDSGDPMSEEHYVLALGGHTGFQNALAYSMLFIAIVGVPIVIAALINENADVFQSGGR